jgi:hypothetical protein
MAREDFRTQLEMFRDRDIQIAALIAFIIGLLIGWFLLGWVIAPVQWINARPADLHPRWQQHYIAMVVDSYLLTGDRATAEERLASFDDETLAQYFGEVQAEFEQAGATRQARAVSQLADQLGITIVPVERQTAEAGTPPAAAAVAQPTAPAPEEPARRSVLNTLAMVCGIVLLVVLLVAGAIAAFLWWQQRTQEFVGGEEEAAGISGRPPGGSQITSMNLGERATIRYMDDGPGYDQTVQIFHGGEIIGSCGLRGVSTLSDSGHVVACAAWLYEPSAPERSADVRVLASRRVYGNDALRRSLVRDHEPEQVIPAEPGQTAHLEHQSLEMTLRIVNVEYTGPDEQYIDTLVVELEPATKRRGFNMQ